MGIQRSRVPGTIHADGNKRTDTTDLRNTAFNVQNYTFFLMYNMSTTALKHSKRG